MKKLIVLLSLCVSAWAANPAPASNLSWVQSTTGCTGSQTCTYNVYRGITPGSETKLASGVVTVTYVDSAVARGSAYCYEITAVNNIGESGFSNEVCVNIPNVPSAPGSLTVTTQ